MRPGEAEAVITVAGLGQKEHRPRSFLCADDFALTEGICDAIERLAEIGHLSATSALVTGENWRRHGARLAGLSEHLAIGLHLNFTWGAPLAAMDRLAPRGRFPSIGELCRRALCGGIDIDEIAAETARQIARFAEIVGRPPDLLDGHQHAHALPGIRRGVITAVEEYFPAGGVLVRDPADSMRDIVQRGVAPAKALTIAFLSRGFGAACRSHRIRTNVGFAGVSSFNPAVPYTNELRCFFLAPGPRHLVMCHPGFLDAELAALDRSATRREEEFNALHDACWLKERIWAPLRAESKVWMSHSTPAPA
jgi:predicted glycoside hydrolase/deacetylase ChbG (UPF0249 family)